MHLYKCLKSAHGNVWVTQLRWWNCINVFWLRLENCTNILTQVFELHKYLVSGHGTVRMSCFRSLKCMDVSTHVIKLYECRNSSHGTVRMPCFRSWNCMNVSTHVIRLYKWLHSGHGTVWIWISYFRLWNCTNVFQLGWWGCAVNVSQLRCSENVRMSQLHLSGDIATVPPPEWRHSYECCFFINQRLQDSIHLYVRYQLRM